MGEGSALIATAPVDLGDDSSGTVGGSRGSGNGKGSSRQGGGESQRT